MKIKVRMILKKSIKNTQKELISQIDKYQKQQIRIHELKNHYINIKNKKGISEIETKNKKTTENIKTIKKRQKLNQKFERNFKCG